MRQSNTNIRHLLTQIGNYLTHPFREEFFFFISLWIVVSAADLYFWSISRNIQFGAYMALHGFLETYGITLLCNLFSKSIRNILHIVFWILGFVNLCVDTGVQNIMDEGFTDDMVAIVMGTNPNETSDFLKMYVNGEMISFILIAASISVILALFLKKYWTKIPSFISTLAVFSVLIGGIAIGVVKSQKWGSVFLGKLYLFAKYEPTKDLHNCQHDCSLAHVSISPSNIVLILGESLSKSHMGLYGYNHSTTPNLSKEANDGRIYKYNRVKSSGVVTTTSFRYMMTTLRQLDDDKDWYSRYTLFDIAKAAGYKTKWISNQSSIGVNDNVVARFAELSDTVVWCGKHFVGGSKHDLDDIILPEVQKVIDTDRDSCSLYFIHLLGSHEDFHSRYPESFNHFSANDYPEAIESQRELLSAYDNSVLFNDYVVDSLIHQFSSQEAIILYLSDHALDIYQSSDDYVGHARASVPQSVEACRDIPFLVYLTDSYKERFPGIETRISKAVENTFYTEDLIYTIMDLMGVEFSDQEPCVPKYSLFRDVE